MRLISSLILFLYFISTISAQRVEYIVGDTIDPKTGSLNFLYHDSAFVYLLRYNENNLQRYYLEKYDLQNLKRLLNIPVPFSKIDSIKINFEAISILEDSFLLFYSYFDRRSKGEKLETVSFNKNGERGKVQVLKFSEGGNERKAGRFNIYNSPGKYYSVKLFQLKNDTDYINISHYDYHFNLIEEFNYKVGNFSKEIYSNIDSAENLVYIASSDAEGIKPKLHLNIFSPKNKNELDFELLKPSQFDIYISPRFHCYYSDNGRLNILTTYSSSIYAKAPFGVYWVQIDIVNHKLINESFLKFKNAKMLNTNENDFDAKSFVISDFVYLSSNSYNLSFESRLNTSASLYAIPIENAFEFGSIYVINADSLFNPNTLFVIPKNQYLRGMDGNYCGYICLQKNDKSLFLFNDLAANKNVLSGEPKKLRPALIDEAEIFVTTTSTSILNKTSLTELSGKRIDALLQPFKTFMLTPNDCISIVENEKTKVSRIARFYIIE